MPAHTRLPSTLAFLIALAALLAPALWNGFPLIFSDTGGYLDRPFEGNLGLGRSALYGAVLAAGLRLDFWPAVIVQAALCVWVIRLVLRVHGLGGKPWLTAALVVTLALLTSLSWTATQLMPDVFVPLAVLALYLLALRRDALRGWEVLGLIVLVAFAIASHMVILALGLTLLAALLLVLLLGGAWRRTWRRTWPRPRIGLPALSIAAGVALALLSNFVIAGQLRFTPGGVSFIFGRLIQDGIVARYVAEHCPNETIRLCAYRDQLPKTADDWLWANGTAFYKLGGDDGYGPEERRIIIETLRLYPFDHLRTAFGSTLAQLGLFTTAVSPGYDNQHAHDTLARLAPALMPRLDAARQQRGGIDVGLLNLVHVPVAVFAFAALPVIIVLCLRRRRDVSLLAATVLVALVANAAICGIFSNPVDRYQSRLMPLALLVVIVAGLSLRREEPARRDSPP